MDHPNRYRSERNECLIRKLTAKLGDQDIMGWIHFM